MKSMVLIGNPGCGKSTTVNCMLNVKLFNSGMSKTGVGVTQTLDVQEHLGTRYMDTPGLSDITLRKEAAKAIEGALSTGGDFQIIFVLTTSSGRVLPDDLLTMKLVLEAANQIPQNCYSIMINKCSKKFLKDMDRPHFISLINRSLEERECPTTNHIHFAPKMEDLEDEDNKLVDLPHETLDFLQKAPRLIVDGGKVQTINADSFDEIKEAMAEEQAQREKAVKAKEEAELREKEALEQEMKERDLRESAERAHQEALQQANLQRELREKAEKAADDAALREQLTKEEAEAKAKKLEALERAREEDARREEAEQEMLEKQREATAQREAQLLAESKRLEALLIESQNKQNEAQKRMRAEQEALRKEVEAQAREAAKLIKDGALVYIKTPEGKYIAEKVLGNGYAGIAKSSTTTKAKFRVSYANVACSNSHATSGIRLEHCGAFNYTNANRYMYASTSGWRYVCYDEKAGNTKQLWRPELAANGRVLGQGTLKYDTEIILRDCFVFSVMCTCRCEYDTTHEYLCSQYENAKDYLDMSKAGHWKTWYLERAA